MTALPAIPVGSHSDSTLNFQVLQRELRDSGWIVPTLLNAWKNSGGEFQTVAYRRIRQEVKIRGIIQGGVSGKQVFELPAGYRPTATEYLVSGAAGETGAVVVVTAAGSVALFYAGAPERAAINCSFMVN